MLLRLLRRAGVTILVMVYTVLLHNENKDLA